MVKGVLVNGWMVGWVGGSINGWMEGWMNRRESWAAMATSNAGDRS